MLILLTQLVLADTITLDTGASIQGDLARYEAGGDCQLSVNEGEFQGVIVILPCARVVSFIRAPGHTPQAVSMVVPEDDGAEEVGHEHADVAPLDTPMLPEPTMPDSIAALREDEFNTPLGSAELGYEVVEPAGPDDDDDAEAEEDEAGVGDQPDAASPPSGPGAPRATPTMPGVSTRSLSF